MKTGRNISEKGQSLILVILSFFALIAMLALVLDGGYTYWMRRNAQNAADAGALAGADVLCMTKDPIQAEITALDYAINRNGVNNANIITTASADATFINPGGIVEVVANINFRSFFSHLFGINSIDAPASATAGCAPPPAGTGVLPVAWSCRPPNVGEDSDSDDCVLHYMQGDVCELGEGNEANMYIIVDATDIEEDVFCQDPPNSGQPNPDYLDCDYDDIKDENDNYNNDLTPLSGGNRSWLDLDGYGGGNIGNWIVDGFPGTITPHTWIAGKPGAATDVYQDTAKHKLLDTVIFPVFDDLCVTGDGDPETECPDRFHHEVLPAPDPLDPDNPDNAEDKKTIEQGNVDFFHIISFSYFYIACVEAGPYGPCPVNDFLNLDPNVKTIEGCFVDGFVSGMGGDVGQGIDTGVYTVFLCDENCFE